MLSFLVGLLHGIFDVLNSLLPSSPFASLAGSLEGASMGLGWLNWFVPVGDMLTLFGLWLVALLGWYVARMTARTVASTALAVAS